MIVDIIHTYAISGGCIFALLLLLNARTHIKMSFDIVYRFVLRSLVYRRLVRRNRFTRMFSRADVILHILLIAVNVFCLSFKASSISVAGVRAAGLSIINLIPAFAGPHLSFLADFFGVSLHTFRRIHRSAGMISFPLLVFHIVAIVAARVPFPLDIVQNMGGLVGASSLCILLLLSFPLFRRPSYEFFLRSHQFMAILFVFSVWRHLEREPFVSRLSVYILFVIFLTIFLLQSVYFLYQNKAMGADLSRASIICDGDAVKVRLRLSRHVRVKAGQYVGLWIPSTSFRSALQTHPFIVTSWSEGKQEHLDLLIKPYNGLTRKLFDLGKVNKKILDTHRANEKLFGKEKKKFTEDDIFIEGLQSHLALFSGPHGLSVPVGDYETVLMIASSIGIASQLPYLKQLVYGYNTCKTHNRRVHLVWQLETDDEISIIELILSEALDQDALDQGFILSISIFVASGMKIEVPVGRRLDVYYGSVPDIGKIFREERQGKYIKRVKNETWKQEDMAVLVSATGLIRDQVRDLMCRYVEEKVTLFELEYQPM